MQYEITTSPAKEDAKTISQGIIDFNHACIPQLEPCDNEVKFCVFARNEANDVVGGIRAVCYWNTLHIELLWLAEECRGQGIGKELLLQAESFAQRNGCAKAFVETTSWQAKPFYEKMHYELIATIADRPKGYASYYLVKSLLTK